MNSLRVRMCRSVTDTYIYIATAYSAIMSLALRRLATSTSSILCTCVATYVLYMLYTSTSSNLGTCILLPCLYIPERMCICYSLGWNSISDEGARAVADSMKYCTSLETLE